MCIRCTLAQLHMQNFYDKLTEFNCFQSYDFYCVLLITILSVQNLSQVKNAHCSICA